MTDDHVVKVMGGREATERFVIVGEDGYSEFWRRDKSPVEPLELAKLLQALRKITLFVGRNVGSIVWSGMEVENAIAIDPTPIMGKYPVPASKVDLMVGIAIQEAYKKVEWSSRLRQDAHARVQPPPQYEYKFDMFFSLCEDVYVDCLSNHGVFGYYTEAARKWRISRNNARLISPPTASEMLHYWWDIAADRNKDRFREGFKDRTVGHIVDRGSLVKFYKPPIDLLNRIVVPLRDECPKIRSVTERGEYRLDLYLSVWPELLDLIKFWPGDSGDRFLVPDGCDEDLAKEDEEFKAVKATIVSYAQLIERAIPNKRHDFTEELKESVDRPEMVVPIEGSDIVMQARNKVDELLLRRLERVVKAATQRRTKFNRGVQTGKIHRRSLYRAHTTGAVFQQKLHEFELRGNIILLVDATGSMADPVKWHQAEVTYQTLYYAIHSCNKNARLFAYNEVKQTCRITELYRAGKMLTVLPQGKTASGEAIIAATMSTRNSQRKRLVIHITDGASNWGCGVDEAISYCRRNRVSLLTLGIGCSPAGKQSLRAEYGNLVEFIDDTAELPRLLSKLLNYDKRP
uniref:IbsF n=1 Tax=Thauera sp. pCyN2 TaxID=1551544 RepID=A0A096ZNX9_9RHOO|nr:IbsF [Thauera sp. pCyN2]